MSGEWFARPVLFVADIERTLAFYVKQLGFSESWRYADNGQASVAQAERQGCALIFSSLRPDKVGKGLMFISLDLDVPADQLPAAAKRMLDQLRMDFQRQGVEVKEGWWGYKVLIVRDPDGNELYFNYPHADVRPAS